MSPPSIVEERHSQDCTWCQGAMWSQWGYRSVRKKDPAGCRSRTLAGPWREPTGCCPRNIAERPKPPSSAAESGSEKGKWKGQGQTIPHLRMRKEAPPGPPVLQGSACAAPWFLALPPFRGCALGYSRAHILLEQLEQILPVPIVLHRSGEGFEPGRVYVPHPVESSYFYAITDKRAIGAANWAGQTLIRRIPEEEVKLADLHPKSTRSTRHG